MSHRARICRIPVRLAFSDHFARAYPCPTREDNKLQVWAEHIVSVDDVLEHAAIGGDLLNIVVYSTKNFES